MKITTIELAILSLLAFAWIAPVEDARAQAQTYTFTGKPLVANSNNTAGCPSVGNVTITLQSTNNLYQYYTATCTAGPYTWQGRQDGTNGSYGQFHINGDGSIEASVACFPPQPSQFTSNTTWITSNYNSPGTGIDENGNSDDVLLTSSLSTSPSFHCDYYADSPGTWSGPVFQLSAKNEGEPTPPEDPEDESPSPVDPQSGAAIDLGPLNGGTGQSVPASIPCTLCGNPINAATGNKVLVETDFAGGSSTGLSFRRTYNSQDIGVSPIGARWRSTWQRMLTVSGSTVTVTRSDGHQDTFTLNSGTYTADPDVQSTLISVTSGGTITAYKLTTVYDTVETYAPSGQLTSVTSRAGLVTTLAYNASYNLTTVTGPFGYTLSFTYDTNNRIATMRAPDGGTYAYAYDSAGNLISVTHPDNSVRRYVYENTSYPNALTGIIDENGNRFATYGYDSQGRATSSQHAGGADLTTVSYGTNTSTVTDARGNAYTFNFTTLFNVVKAVSLSGAPVQTSGGRAFTYDSNGFIASRTDWNGNVTTYSNDARGNVLSRTLGTGTSQATTTTQTWDQTFHLPLSVTEQGRVASYSYDTHGNALTKTVTSPTTPTSTWTYTYNAQGEVLRA